MVGSSQACPLTPLCLGHTLLPAGCVQLVASILAPRGALAGAHPTAEERAAAELYLLQQLQEQLRRRLQTIRSGTEQPLNTPGVDGGPVRQRDADCWPLEMAGSSANLSVSNTRGGAGPADVRGAACSGLQPQVQLLCSCPAALPEGRQCRVRLYVQVAQAAPAAAAAGHHLQGRLLVHGSTGAMAADIEVELQPDPSGMACIRCAGVGVL